jgi:hypothetical protein
MRRLGGRARIAATGVTAVVVTAAGVGIGLAVADNGEHSATMSVSTQESGHAGNNSGTTAKGDPSRQAWAHQYGQDRAAMPNLPDVGSASPQQQAAAADLLARTKSATAAYADTTTAQAAGFDIQAALARAEQRNPGLARRMQRVDSGQMPARMPMLHVANKANRRDGKVLDPSAPETLMYEYQGHNTWKLIGVMYTANESFPQAPPDPGGPITRWHYHDKHGGAALMMHIFFVPENDLAHAYALMMDSM